MFGMLFDFIEEMHKKGEPLERARVDAGIMRLRPVMITVDGFRSLSVGAPRWTAVEAAVLFANRRPRRGHVHHLTACPGALRHFRA